MGAGRQREERHGRRVRREPPERARHSDGVSSVREPSGERGLRRTRRRVRRAAQLPGGSTDAAAGRGDGAVRGAGAADFFLPRARLGVRGV